MIPTSLRLSAPFVLAIFGAACGGGDTVDAGQDAPAGDSGALDGGATDSGTDAGDAAGTGDGGMDSGTDDTGIGDAGTDDASADATAGDAGTDDAGLDAAAGDAGPDLGTDAGLLACPAPGSLADGQPFADYVLDASTFFSGTATSYLWTVTSHDPCDELFLPEGGTTYTLTGATTSILTLHPTLSGTFTIQLVIDLPDGTSTGCTFDIAIRAPGIRVELCWDTTGATDLDLHVHRSGTTSRWFSTSGTMSTINTDDCYYYDCKASSAPPLVAWGYAHGPLAECDGGPEGAMWTTLGYCSNPRLEIDNISTMFLPESTAIDAPRDGDTFRVMAHYFGGTATTHPLVAIYCAGDLAATFGAAPDLVSGFTSGSGWDRGQMWRVADIVAHATAGVTTGCDVRAIHPPGLTTGYYVTNGNDTY